MCPKTGTRYLRAGAGLQTKDQSRGPHGWLPAPYVVEGVVDEGVVEGDAAEVVVGGGVGHDLCGGQLIQVIVWKIPIVAQ